MEFHRRESLYFLSVCFQGTISVCKRIYSIVALLYIFPKSAIDISFRITIIKVFGVSTISLVMVNWRLRYRYSLNQ